MSILDWLRGQADAKTARGDTETVRRIIGELDRMEPSGARHLAAFAYVLSRVAAADLDVSHMEVDKMAEIVERVGRLSEAQAVLVVQIARNQNRLFGGTEDFLVTREFREIATDEQRSELFDCLFAVAAADGEISAEEEGQIRQIASELGISHADYVRARLAYSDKRSVFRREGA
ncbi:MAG: TerB family tellurite resistance protein [Vicinamibacterales bacterium]